MEAGSLAAPRGILSAIARVRQATLDSPFEGKIYLVGGILRDRALGLPPSGDADLVVESDAVDLARFLYGHGLSRHYPVLYPRFGTAMLTVETEEGDGAIELVTARSESYHSDSRKPNVTPGTICDDVLRRDFTINTLLENLHTGELLDLTGLGLRDLDAGILRTPREPRITFFDDPLRMLRAVRFAARFDFQIESGTWQAIQNEAERLRPPAIAWERIREEFAKIVQLPARQLQRGMLLLQECGLLERFLPEMLPLIGCTQGAWHHADVWSHTIEALGALPDAARLELRLGLLWHDIGKPATRVETNDAKGVRFTGHASVGAEMVREMMGRLKFSNEETRDVSQLVQLHMRLGEYRPEWTDASVKRLIRDCGAYLDDLFELTRCDQSAIDMPAEYRGYLAEMRERIDVLNALSNVLRIESPLNGVEIMEVLGAGPGPHLREAKELLVNDILDGRLAESNKTAAVERLRTWWSERTNALERGEDGLPPP